MDKESEYAIVGGGPAGIVFHNELINRFPKADIVLFEKGEFLCSDVSTYGRFVRNHGVDDITKWDFLTEGNYYGLQVSNFFQGKFTGKVLYTGISKITKVGEVCQLLTITGETYLTKRVILATGVRLKEIEAIENLSNQKFNISSISTEELKTIDFSNFELILIGSGDKTLLKAIRIAKHLEENSSHLPYTPITILVKDMFTENANPEFLKEIKLYIKTGLIQVITNCWQIEVVKLMENNMVHQIISRQGEYSVKAPQGAYLGVFIGFEGRIPELINCDINDFVCVGDLALALDKKKINITAALLDAERKARGI